MELTAEQYQVLLEWAERNFIPTGTINTNVCAYTIHGIFERLYDKGFYVTEFDVARALRECGYRSVERDGQIYFNVSQKSRAIQIFRSSLGDPSKVPSPEWL
jgi:hypothetical protein